MDAVDRFFSQYPTFNYNREALPPQEFYRLCKTFRWRKNEHGKCPPAREEAYEGFRRAMVENFNDAFGRDINNIVGWEHMCMLLGMDLIPQGLDNIKERIKETHVNLADLLDGHRSGAAIPIFQTNEDLASYTIATSKYFPKEDAYAGGVLRFSYEKFIIRITANTGLEEDVAKASAAARACESADVVNRT